MARPFPATPVAGLLISQSGTWMQNIAQGYLVYTLTGSEAALGLVALAMGLPLLFLSPMAGVIVRRIQGKSHRTAGMHADAGDGDFTA